MQVIDPIFDYRTVSWEAAAQEAAFEGRCFCMRNTGRVINRASMQVGIPHSNPHLNGEFSWVDSGAK